MSFIKNKIIPKTLKRKNIFIPLSILIIIDNQYKFNGYYKIIILEKYSNLLTNILQNNVNNSIIIL